MYYGCIGLSIISLYYPFQVFNKQMYSYKLLVYWNHYIIGDHKTASCFNNIFIFKVSSWKISFKDTVSHLASLQVSNARSSFFNFVSSFPTRSCGTPAITARKISCLIASQAQAHALIHNNIFHSNSTIKESRFFIFSKILIY